MPRTTGVLETCLYVEDLRRAREFYQRVFGFEVFFADPRMCAMGVPGGQVLLLFHRGATLEPAPAGGGFIPPHHGDGPLHVCFAIPLGRKGAPACISATPTITRSRSRHRGYGRIIDYSGAGDASGLSFSTI